MFKTVILYILDCLSKLAGDKKCRVTKGSASKPFILDSKKSEFHKLLSFTICIQDLHRFYL